MFSLKCPFFVHYNLILIYFAVYVKETKKRRMHLILKHDKSLHDASAYFRYTYPKTHYSFDHTTFTFCSELLDFDKITMCSSENKGMSM